MSSHHLRGKGLYRSTSGEIVPPSSHWKSYLLRDFNNQTSAIRKNQYERNIKMISPQNSISRITYDQPYSAFEEENRRKSEMLKRVKQIKQKVKPLLQNSGKEERAEEMNVNRRLQKRIMKLETAVDQLQKKMDLRIQEKFIQLKQFVIQRLNSIEQNQHK